jgi:hypothetical protein
VNHVWAAGDIYFRTVEGSKLSPRCAGSWWRAIHQQLRMYAAVGGAGMDPSGRRPSRNRPSVCGPRLCARHTPGGEPVLTHGSKHSGMESDNPVGFSVLP